MPEFSDNQTTLLVVLIIGVLTALTAIITSKNIGGAIHRLAEAKENENSARAEDLEKVRKDIRAEIRTEANSAADAVGRELDVHIEKTQGAVVRLDGDVDRVDENVARVADVVAETVTAVAVTITGQSWWGTEGHPLAGRVRADNVRLASEEELAAAAARHDPNNSSGAHTAVLPAMTDQPHVSHPGDRTMAILSGRTPMPVDQQQELPFDPHNPRAVWQYMMGWINADNTDPETQSWPWDIHQEYVGATGSKYSNYDVFRAHVGGMGFALPENMHVFWPDLHTVELWKRFGPKPGEEHYSAKYPPHAHP